MKKLEKVKHFLGFHRFKDCYAINFQGNKEEDVDFVDKRYTPQEFSYLVEHRYKCSKCGAKFWYEPAYFLYCQLAEDIAELLKK